VRRTGLDTGDGWGGVCDGVVCPQPDPLWDGSVLPLLLSEDLLDLECLVRRHDEER
jgi:hypothetical protein